MTDIARTAPAERLPRKFRSDRASAILFEIDRSWTYRALALFGVMIIGGAFATFVVPGRSYVEVFLNDVFGFIDVAYRVHLGQHPYTDFHFPYGPAVALIPGLGLDLGFSVGTIFGLNSLVAVTIVSVVALLSLPQRLPFPCAAVVFIFVCLLVVVPMAEGRYFHYISWGTFYNRHGWAAIILLLLFYVEPKFVRPHDRWLDASLISVLVLFGMYTKFTFGAVALGFVFANMLVSNYNRQVSLLSLSMVAVALICLEAVFQFHVVYVENIIEFLVQVEGGNINRWHLLSMAIHNIEIILACLGALVLTRTVGRRVACDVFFVIGAIVATALLRCSIGDNADGRLVALVGVLVCLSELARRAGATTLSIAGSDWRRHFPAIGCLFLAVLFMSQETINRALAWQSYAEQVFSQAATESPDNPQTLAGLIVPMNGQNRFVIPDENGCNPELTRLRAANATSDLFASEYLHTVKDGIVLLRAVDHRSKTVFTFDAVNPFPYAVEMQPPRNGYPLFWIGGRVTSNPQLLPRPEDLLRDVDLVMVPRLPYSASQLSHMVRIYGSYLTLNYVPLSESTCWELWTRNTR